MAKARAELEITANDSRLSAGLARARSAVSSWAISAARGVGKAFDTAWSAGKWVNKKLAPGDTAKKAIGEFGGNLMTRGFDAITDAAKGVRDFERDLVRFQITAGKSSTFADEMRTSIRGISRDTGIAAEDVLAGARSYVDLTGDVSGAVASMRSFARISQASGASMDDIATATASLKTSLNLDPTQVEAVFSGMIVQGKKGAVTLKDFASQLSTLAPQFAQFGVTGTAGIAEMGAAFQMVRTGAGSAAEAATQFEALMGELVKSHGELKQVGIDVWQKNPKTGQKELKSLTAILDQVASNKLLSDPAVMMKIFGRKESQQAVRSVQKHIEMLHDLTKAAEDHGAVERDLATFTESDAGRMDVAMNKLKETIAEVFTPERIEGFTRAVEQLVDKLQPVIESVGAVGDALGALYGAGKAIRGAFAGSQNPYAVSTEDRRVAVNEINDETDPNRKKALLQKLAFGLANEKSYQKTADDILGGEINERSTPESIKRAIVARFTGPEGPGALGRQDAAMGYLTAAGLSKDQQEQRAGEIAGKDILDALNEISDTLKQGMPPPVLKVGDNQVAKSVGQATTVRAQK